MEAGMKNWRFLTNVEKLIVCGMDSSVASCFVAMSKMIQDMAMVTMATNRQKTYTTLLNSVISNDIE